MALDTEHTRRHLRRRDNNPVDKLWFVVDKTMTNPEKQTGARRRPSGYCEQWAAYFSPTTITLTWVCTSACSAITASNSPV
jgi:hypothetical protein